MYNQKLMNHSSSSLKAQLERIPVHTNNRNSMFKAKNELVKKR